MEGSRQQLPKNIEEIVSNPDINRSDDTFKNPFSISKSWSQSKILPIELKHSNTREKSLNSDMQEVINHFSEFKPSRTHTPCEGKCLFLKVPGLTFYFGCKSSILFCGSIELKDKKIPMKFSETGIRSVCHLGQSEILIMKKLNSLIRYKYTLTLDPITTKPVDFTLEFIAKLRKSDKTTNSKTEFRGLNPTNSQDFLTLDNESSKSSVCLWSGSKISKVLYECESRGLVLESSEDFFFVVSGHENSLLIIYNNSSCKPERLQESKLGKISSLKITKKNNFLAVGGNQSLVIVFDLGNLNKAFELNGHSVKISALICTDDERVLISGGNDGKIYLFDLKGNIDGYLVSDLALSSPDRKMVCVKSMVLQENGVLFCFGNDGLISGFKLPNLNQYYILKSELRLSEGDLLFTTSRSDQFEQKNFSGFSLLYALKQNRLYSLDTISGDVINENKFDYQEIVNLTVDTFSNVICVVVQKERKSKEECLFEAIFYNYKQRLEEKRIKFQADLVEKVLTSLQDDILVISAGFQYRVFRILSGREMLPIVHKNEISYICLHHSNKIIYSGDSQGIIQIHRVLENSIKEEHVINYIKSPVVKMWVKDMGIYLISTHKDNNLYIFEIIKGIMIDSLNEIEVLDIIFPCATELMFCLTPNSVKCFHIPSLISYFSISLSPNPKKFCFSQDETLISVHTDSGFYIYRSPLATQEIMPYGEMDKISLFYENVIDLIKGKLKDHETFLNSWYLAPYGINIMHVYAYLDCYELMDQGFADNCGVFPSISGYTPIDISLEMAYQDTIETIYERLLEINPLKLWVLESSLIRINLCSYYPASKLYELFLLKSNDKTLPKFYKSSRKLPIIAMSPNLLVRKELFMWDYEWSLEGKEIMFKQSYMKINMVPGSRDSILLARSIGETLNGELFNTEFFKVMIDEKWKKIRYILYGQAAIYITYLVLISIYGIHRIYIIFVLSFAINLVLIIYEGIELIRSPIDYFRDKYNFCDIARSFLTCFYFARDYSGYEISRIEIVILVILTWFQAFSYFRLIGATRYFINLLFAVVSDIIPFLSFLLTVTLGLSIIYTVILDHGEGYYHFLKVAWELNVGGFDTSGYNGVAYFVFFGHTLIIPIMLLNLLISIMSDTFDKVNNQLAWADGKELITMVIEAENILFWNRNKNNKEFLHLCHRKVRDDKNEQTDVKLRTKVNKLQEQSQIIMGDVKSLKENFLSINGKIDEILKNLARDTPKRV